MRHASAARQPLRTQPASPAAIYQEIDRFVRENSPRYQQKRAKQERHTLEEMLESHNAEDSAEIVNCGRKKKRLDDIALRFEGLASDLGISPGRDGHGMERGQRHG